MNHWLFSASFRYALKHETPFQIFCNASIWVQSGSSRAVARFLNSCRPSQTCINVGRYAEGVQRAPRARTVRGVRGHALREFIFAFHPLKRHFLHF